MRRPAAIRLLPTTWPGPFENFAGELPMFESFQPTLLVSMPQLQDPNFARAVVLLCDYTPDGAFGLVLNRPTDLPASTMVRLEPAIADGNALPLCLGGPVEPDRGWILLADPPEEPEFRTICEGVVSIHVTGAAAAHALDVARSPRARAGGLRRMGPRATRHRARGVGVAHRENRYRPCLRHRARLDVGSCHPSNGRRPVIAADESRGALRRWLSALGFGLLALGSSKPSRAHSQIFLQQFSLVRSVRLQADHSRSG